MYLGLLPFIAVTSVWKFVRYEHVFIRTAIIRKHTKMLLPIMQVIRVASCLLTDQMKCLCHSILYVESWNILQETEVTPLKMYRMSTRYIRFISIPYIHSVIKAKSKNVAYFRRIRIACKSTGSSKFWKLFHKILSSKNNLKIYRRSS